MRKLLILVGALVVVHVALLFVRVSGAAQPAAPDAVNVGIVLYCPERRFLGARTGGDPARLTALAPDCDVEEVESHLAAIQRVAAGEADAGPIARLSKAERYHWLASPPMKP